MGRRYLDNTVNFLCTKFGSDVCCHLPMSALLLWKAHMGIADFNFLPNISKVRATTFLQTRKFPYGFIVLLGRCHAALKYQRKSHFWEIINKIEENSWESACESLSGRFLRLMNCQEIRSFPSVHTIWIHFQSPYKAVQLPIMWSTHTWGWAQVGRIPCSGAVRVLPTCQLFHDRADVNIIHLLFNNQLFLQLFPARTYAAHKRSLHRSLKRSGPRSLSAQPVKTQPLSSPYRHLPHGCLSPHCASIIVNVTVTAAHNMRPPHR